MTKYFHNFLRLLFFLIFLSCAQKGRITGGEKDITPPVLISSSPDTLSTNVPIHLKEIELRFDEYVTLRDFIKNIIISPPVEPMPTFYPQGTADKKVKITFNDSLLPNTTYNINFGRSLVDNNEGNVQPYFSYVFSTGDYIDSLEVTGRVYDPALKKLPDNIIVGLYDIDENYNDSLILSEKPLYIGKVDSTGNFSLNYLKEGDYQLIAFTDEINNTRFDQDGETIAFHQAIVNPQKQENGISLKLFPPLPKFKVKEVVQEKYGQLNFIMDGKPDSIHVTPLNHEFPTAKIIHKAYSDTLQFWFDPVKDTIEDRNKRLQFAVEYQGLSDTLRTDRYDRSKKHELKLGAVTSSYIPQDGYLIRSNYPIQALDSSFIKVQEDTININYQLKKENEFEFLVRFPVQFEKKYTIDLLPGAVTDFFDQVNDTLSINNTVENERAYGNIKITLQNKPDSPVWIQLLNQRNEVILTEYTQENVVNFQRIVPGSYFLKLIVDANGNRQWDTGDFFSKRQPEPIFLYQDELAVKAFWDLDEVWILPGENMTPPPAERIFDESLEDEKNTPIDDTEDEKKLKEITEPVLEPGALPPVKTDN